MKTRAALVLAAVGGLASMAHGQAQVFVNGAPVTMNYTFTVGRMNVSDPNPNNWTVLEQNMNTAVPLAPGQGAYLRLSMQMTPGFTGSATAPTTVATWSPSIVGGLGSGWLWGIGGMFIDLVGTPDAAHSTGAQGSWSTTGGTGQGPTGTYRGVLSSAAQGGIWSVGDSTTFGTPVNNGARLANIQAGQFGGNVLSLNTTDPVVNIWRGVWIPSTYAGQTVNFAPANNSAGVGASSAVMANGDLITANDTIPLGANTNNNFGNGVSIPVSSVPGPSSLALLGLGGLVAARRRRA
jgi:MYXO-CTERM domain-containing protein